MDFPISSLFTFKFPSFLYQNPNLAIIPAIDAPAPDGARPWKAQWFKMCLASEYLEYN